MRYVIRVLITLGIIIFCGQIGRKMPTLAGLIAVMPLTGLMVLLWIYMDNPGDTAVLSQYIKGAVWGILPSMLFFFVAFFCFCRQMSLTMVLSVSFGVWLVGACVHQWLLR